MAACLLGIVMSAAAQGDERERVIPSGAQVLIAACTKESPSFKAGRDAGRQGDQFLVSFSGQYSGGEDPALAMPEKKRACANFKKQERDCCETGYLSAIPELADRIDYFPPETRDQELILCKQSHDLGAKRGARYCDLNPGKKQANCLGPEDDPIDRPGCYRLGLIRELQKCDAAGIDREKLASILGEKREYSPQKPGIILPGNPRSTQAEKTSAGEAAE